MNTPTPAALDAAFVALQAYDAGSSRGALRPIDAAVRAAIGDPLAQLALERRLVECLNHRLPIPAQEYVCTQLGRIGGRPSVPTLAARLQEPPLVDTATRCLQMIPGDCASAALRAALRTLAGVPLAGVVAALGERRDTASVSALSRLLRSAEPAVAAAAASALGRIGTPPAGDALERFLRSTSAGRLPAAREAALVCADRLEATGGATAVATALRTLAKPGPPRSR